jgi:hypothetical protein
MGGACSNMGEIRITYKVLVEKHEGKSPLGRGRRSWKDDIRIDFKEMGWEGVEWIHLAQDRDQWWALVNTAMNFRVS